MITKIRCSLSVALLLVLPPATAGDGAAGRWADEMARFDREDRERPPRRGGVVFVGSSSILLWDLKDSFPDAEPLNRGFGGSHLSDVVREADRLVLRHAPRVVVLYAGENDLAAGTPRAEVVADFENFVATVRRERPDAGIVVIAIKPSLARWRLADTFREANAKIEAACRRDARCEFLDVWAPMLDTEGKPRKDLFLFDGLHLNRKGYGIWTELVAPHLR